jgi:succinate dehydrogenase/fumarate reductase flavoprotein subunit
MNTRDNALTHDVVIVGAGLAGLSAAIEAADAGADVAIVSKVHPVRSHSGAAQGGINAAIRPDDDWHDHRYDTIKGSGYLADQDAVTVLCQEAPDAIAWLADFGTPFTRTKDGLLAQRPFGGQRRDRTCYAADKTGHNILHTLWEQTQRRGVKVYAEWFMTRLLPGEGGAWPALVAMDLVSGDLATLAAPAVVLATGGAARIFGQSTNALINTGDGVALAWRAGLAAEDMEFFQIHPTGLLNGILMTEGCRGEGAYLAMRDAFGLFKDDAGMRKGRDRIRACRARLGGVFTHDKGRVFNHDLVHVLQLESMLDVALMCAEASIPRTESRGGHYRTDAPKLDNANWLKHTVIRRTDDGDVRLQYKPVTIEDIQPESEIKY